MWNKLTQQLITLHKAFSGNNVYCNANNNNDVNRLDGSLSAIADSTLDAHIVNTEQKVEEHFCPIFILSKGRYNSERGTISLLIRDQVPFTVVVQSEEVTLYERLIDRLITEWWGGNKSSEDSNGNSSEAWLCQHREPQHMPSVLLQTPVSAPPPPPPPLNQRRPQDISSIRRLIKIESLPLSNKGVSYVRNYILTELAPARLTSLSSSSSSGVGRWFWVMDDDIQRFYVAWKGKNYVITPRQLFTEVYTRIQNFHSSFCNTNEIAIFSLEYPRFAFNYSDGDMALNSYNNIACLFNYNLIPSVCHYRFRIREDYDFTLQLISHGLKTVRFRNLSFDVPRMAEVAGGMTDYYRTQKEDIRQQNKLFVETWPAVSYECIKGKGALQRDDIRVRWDLLHPKKNLNPTATLQSRTPLQVKTQNHLPSRVAESPPQTTEGCRGKEKKSGKGRLGMKRKRVISATHERCEAQPKTITKTRGSCVEEDKQTETAGVKRRAEPGWKGYVLERWRDLSLDEAKRLHLTPIPSEKLRLGQTVAVVPPMFEQNPSVVEAVLVDKSVRQKRRRTGGTSNETTEENGKSSERDSVIEWSAVARGMPVLIVTRCYEIPAVGIDVAAAAVDAFFANEE